jgi:tRNA nucleotidyltransferase (CCA-adding enzyme)
MKYTIGELKNRIPEYIFSVADVLVENDFDAYLVGGAVRDILLDRKPKDYDLATNALPEDIVKIFPKTVNTNAKFGTILVIMTDEKGENFDVEVTTYRKEEDYVGGRWPSKVEFTTDIKHDLSRRDFTINAMALNFKDILDQGVSVEEVVFDPFDGIKDLETGIICAVGDPVERFSEDGLRAFKACRLASELDFIIDEATFQGIKETLHVAEKISMERVRDEFVKLLMYSPKPSKGIDLLRQSGLLKIFLPELLDTIGVNQPKWHDDDVYTHSLKTLDLAEDSIKLAALFHDIGKPHTLTEDEDGIHFYGHDKVGSEITGKIMKRLKFSNSEIKRVQSLVRWHMFYYPSAEWRKENELDSIVENVNDGGWSDGAIRRFIKNIGGEELIDDLFKLRIADATSNTKSPFETVEIEALQQRISEVRQKDMALKVTDLDVSGVDLKNILGIDPGPNMGKVLNFLLDKVIEEPSLNKKDKLIELAKRYQSNNV